MPDSRENIIDPSMIFFAQPRGSLLQSRTCPDFLIPIAISSLSQQVPYIYMFHGNKNNNSTIKPRMQELPLGYRFYPTEEELVSFYLRNQLDGNTQELHRVIPVIDIYGIEPWELPQLAGERCQGDREQWFFFTPRQEREARGGRPTRTTASGYWKATGSPGHVYSSDNQVIGVKKTMVFYRGKAPTGRKTKWKMHEYRAIEEVDDPFGTTVPKLRHEFSLCRVYVISGSFRAFDRRPQEAVTRETQLLADIAATSAQDLAMVEKTSSSETSFSGGDHTDLPGGTAGTAILGTVDGLEQPLYEWERLNWP